MAQLETVQKFSVLPLYMPFLFENGYKNTAGFSLIATSQRFFVFGLCESIIDHYVSHLFALVFLIILLSLFFKPYDSFF